MNIKWLTNVMVARLTCITVASGVELCVKKVQFSVTNRHTDASIRNKAEFLGI